jgi:hypothetical protein
MRALSLAIGIGVLLVSAVAQADPKEVEVVNLPAVNRPGFFGGSFS